MLYYNGGNTCVIMIILVFIKINYKFFKNYVVF